MSEHKSSRQKKNVHLQNETEKEPSLKGTLVSVMFLGAFIVVSWVSIFFLFILRM